MFDTVYSAAAEKASPGFKAEALGGMPRIAMTMDFDETRWDLIPPMRPRSSGASRVKKTNFEIYV